MPRMDYQAYKDGYKAGHLDRFIGVLSEYAWASLGDRNPYAAAYGQGYRDGALGLPMRTRRPF